MKIALAMIATLLISTGLSMCMIRFVAMQYLKDIADLEKRILTALAKSVCDRN